MSYVRSPYSEFSFKRFLRTAFAVTQRQYLSFIAGCMTVVVLSMIFALTRHIEMGAFFRISFGAFGAFLGFSILTAFASRLQRDFDRQRDLYEMQQINADPERLRQFQADVERGREILRRSGAESLLSTDQDVIKGEVISRRDH